MARATGPTRSSGAFSTSAQADSIVKSMLVPVSPSGTGKTLRALMAC